MKQAIKVTANEEGNVVNVSLNKPEYGYIRVAQKINSFTSDGWLKTEERSFLLKGLLDNLQNVGFDAGQTLPGNLVRIESLEPFSEVSKPKVAGDTGVICKVNGQPIYSKVEYDTTGQLSDKLIAHDNKEEIVAALSNRSVLANDYPVATEDAFEAPEQETIVEETVSETINHDTNEDVVEEVVEDAVEEVQELDLETDFEL